MKIKTEQIIKELEQHGQIERNGRCRCICGWQSPWADTRSFGAYSAHLAEMLAQAVNGA